MSMRKLKTKGIGRYELLQWLNRLLEMDYAKIEELQDGVAYVQLLDALYPNAVPLHLVRFRSNMVSDWEYNFKIFRRVLSLKNIVKELAIRKLTDGVFCEHLELLQWMHTLVHQVCPNVMLTYRAHEARQLLTQRRNSKSDIEPKPVATIRSDFMNKQPSVQPKKSCVEKAVPEIVSPRVTLNALHIPKQVKCSMEHTLRAHLYFEKNNIDAHLIQLLNVELQARVQDQTELSAEIDSLHIETTTLRKQLQTFEVQFLNNPSNTTTQGENLLQLSSEKYLQVLYQL